ncbi:hypothetical protein [Francisella salimarina]|uniref:hypothetical protein n=1 Tax=Francisella salimarina TaxID=2599927 RepID=UPI003D813CEB
MNVCKHSLSQKLEPFIFNRLQKDRYEIVELSPSKLLTWNRLDLAFKLFYLDNKDKNKEIAVKVYKEDIKAQTLGSFEEIGNQDKNSFEKYIKEFSNTYKNIKEKGFNENQTLIPLSNVNTIINGAHRVSSAIHLDKKITCVKLDEPIMICDYNYFYERDVSSNILDIVVSKFIEYSENTYIAFLWPSGDGKKNLLSQSFLILYIKKDSTK